MIETQSGTPVAWEINRIVHGGRGSYVEFTDGQIDRSNMVIPEIETWRSTSGVAYYEEWRTWPDGVKVYHQRRPVSYADYVVGRWYIAVADLKLMAQLEQQR